MARIKGKTKVSVKKKPIKAGSKTPHGGFPTQKVILINAKLKADIDKKNG